MASLGSLPPSMKTAPPGSLGASLIDVLARTECPALTSRRARRSERAGAPQDPIVWREAVGSNVVDVYVRYLRRKLGTERFVTLRGMGYRLDDIA